MTYRVRRRILLTLGIFIPHTAVVAGKALVHRRRAPRLVAAREYAAAEARKPFSYDEAESFLVGRGVPRDALRRGSVGPAQLRFAAQVVAKHAPRRALRALHIGNFVGVSLAALSDIVVGHDPESRVVSIDPNVLHLGVDDPQGHTLALLAHFGVAGRNVVIPGYSLARPVGAAGLENVLLTLERLGQRFDLVFVDGNHEPQYVRAELEILVRLVEDGGLLILDDVSHSYEGIQQLFEEVGSDDGWPLQKLGHDGLQIGVLRKVAGSRG
jgi:predicted O-methyltransferase YrrM